MQNMLLKEDDEEFSEEDKELEQVGTPLVHQCYKLPTLNFVFFVTNTTPLDAEDPTDDDVTSVTSDGGRSVECGDVSGAERKKEER